MSNRGAVERCLGLCTFVQRGETLQALLLTLNVFLILTAYLIAKVVREPLILAGGGGAELKSYAAALQVVVLLVVVRVYDRLVADMPRRRLINVVTIFFAGCLFAFYGLQLANIDIGIIFYLWVGIFSLTIIAQFWAFANDIYTPEQGKRLFPLIAFGASAGGVFGPMIADALIEPLGVYQLLPLAGAILLASLLLTNFVESRAVPVRAPGAVEPEISKDGALRVVFKNRYLLLIALLVLFSNWANTTGEYILARSVSEAAAAQTAVSAEVFIGSFYATFFTIVGAAGLILQLVVVSRVVKYLGMRAAILALPIVALGSYALIAVVPILWITRVGKTAENSVDYSLNNTVKQLLFLPTTREEKYKAKIAIDSLFVRAGDVLSAGVVFIGASLGMGVRHFALWNLLLVAAWLLVATKVGAENRRRTVVGA